MADLPPFGPIAVLTPPLWGQDVPAEIEAIETCATGEDDFDAEYRIARIAEELMDAGVLASQDHQATLDATINAGLKRLLVAEGCGRLESLDLSLRWTDDIVEAMELDSSSCCEGAAGWWNEFGDVSKGYSMPTFRLLSNGREVSEVPPLSAFAVRASSSVFPALKDWYNALRYEMGGDTAAQIIRVLSAGIDYIGGFDFAYYAEQIEKRWDVDVEGDLNTDNDALTLGNYYSQIPKACCGHSFSLRKLSNARKRSVDATARIREVVEAAHNLGVIVDRYGKAWEAQIANSKRDHANSSTEFWHHRFNQIGHFLFFVPPIALAWSGEHGDDPCLRMMDYEVDMIQSDDHSDVVWLQGFDLDKADDGPGSLPFAIGKLRQMAQVVGVLDRLVSLLTVRAPETPSIRRGEPQHRSRRGVRRNPALIENLDRLGSDTDDDDGPDTGEMLCRL